MKTVKIFLLMGAVLLTAGACDNDFVEINTNPYAITDIDPELLFADAQRVSHVGTWAVEHTIVQHFQNAYNTGATVGFNFNFDTDLNNNAKWDASYPNALKSIAQALKLLDGTTDRVNLQSMLRIWRAQIFMGLVDNYGDVPYFDAGGALNDDPVFYPAYDDDAAIYSDIHDELVAAIGDLNTSGDFVSSDLFYGTFGSEPAADASAQVAQWRKLGNSLLLRLGMRYTKIATSTAQSIVAEALTNGGPMTSNADNAYIVPDGSLFFNNDNNNLRNFSHFNYAAEPLVDNLKANNDPRGPIVLGLYPNPSAVATGGADNTLANQFGVPVGIEDTEIVDPLNAGTYRGANPNGGLNYSQINVQGLAAPDAPYLFVSYAETALLLAEAAQRGWVTTGTAQSFYEAGITADMQWYSMYPGGDIAIGDITTYLAEPNVAFNAGTAFEQINTQLWLVHLKNGTEAFANFRRSGFPVLTRNPYDNSLVTGSGSLDGFAHRLSYPDREGSANAINYTAAIEPMGGDLLTARVFWDVP